MEIRQGKGFISLPRLPSSGEPGSFSYLPACRCGGAGQPSASGQEPGRPTVPALHSRPSLLNHFVVFEASVFVLKLAVSFQSSHWYAVIANVEEGVETGPTGPCWPARTVCPRVPNAERFLVNIFHKLSAHQCAYTRTCQQNLEPQQESMNTFHKQSESHMFYLLWLKIAIMSLSATWMWVSCINHNELETILRKQVS